MMTSTKKMSSPRPHFSTIKEMTPAPEDIIVQDHVVQRKLEIPYIDHKTNI